jgi:hypothetical protein
MPNPPGDQAATPPRLTVNEPPLNDSEQASDIPEKDKPAPEAEDHGPVSGENEDDGDDSAPPLPPGPPPDDEAINDGWQPIWDEQYGAYYFYNSITGETTWTNPRVPPTTDEASTAPKQNLKESGSPNVTSDSESAAETQYHDPLQYNPAIHGDYDPTAPYAQPRPDPAESRTGQYVATAAFNRFTGKFTPSSSHLVPENYNDENKSKRQMEFYFDVDAAANSHDGRSLKAERQTKRLSKQELKQYKEKRKQRKEEKRKAWLRD